ncbi:MAG TPA: MFS transporter [Rhizomicrobium sp.]|jgi:SHS family lactate transporter-like MFS transporter|nr:MFS transporter [Rhizomicrobium sp.]
MFDALKGWTPAQKHAVAASFLGWTLDAFDFFLMVFVIKDVAKSFGAGKDDIAWAVALTLMLRPVGAFIFGRLADRFGRRPVLMADVALYSIFGFATAFAPNLLVFLVVRALFGVAMGGEWGIGASLAMETVRPEARGLVSGLLQSGYPTGYLLASIVYRNFYGHFGAWTGMAPWRSMFLIGIVPALLILYIRRTVPESPGWSREHARTGTVLSVLRRHWGIALYAIALMTAFNFLSHGTQDIYPTFLQVQHKFGVHTTGNITIIYNIGAILGGWTFGLWSQTLGRRRAMIVAALCAIPAAYLWAFSETATTLAIGAFVMQFFVQGAWGVVPAHLNELAPADARGTFPGTVYQLGNFIASYNAVLQTRIAMASGENYSMALAGVAVAAAIAIVVLAAFGREARDVKMGASV